MINVTAVKKSNITKNIFLLCLFTLAIPLFAHEFWLQPDKFIYKRGDNVNVKFLVGENFEGDNWSGNITKVKSLKLYFLDVEDDLSAQLSENKGDSLHFSFYDECTAMVTFNSTNSFISLGAKKFNDYLIEDGLQNAIDYRKQNNETDSSSREFYQRSVKTIFQVGAKKNNVSVVTGLPLDIIPQLNPYTLKSNDSLSLQILFNKQPLLNNVIKVWHRYHNKTILQQLTTDVNGKIKIKITTNGKWMVSTVKMEHIDNNEKANWQSFWGSCTWGYE